MDEPRIYAFGEDPAPLKPSPPNANHSFAFGPSAVTPPKGTAAGPKTKSRERFQTLNAFVDRTLASLTPAEALVWLVIYRDTRNEAATVSMRSIAKRAGRTLRAVRAAVKALERRGLLHVVRRGCFRRGTSTYRVVAACKSDSAPVVP